MQDVPLAVLTATLCTYWIGVGVMIVRVRRAMRRSAERGAAQRFERFNATWIVWVALVASWVGIPWATLAQSPMVPALPAFAASGPYAALRWIAALVSVIALGATIAIGFLWLTDDRFVPLRL